MAIETYKGHTTAMKRDFRLVFLAPEGRPNALIYPATQDAVDGDLMDMHLKYLPNGNW